METTFGELVRAAREARGLKGYELAQAIGRHPSYVSDLENGKRAEAPPPDVLAALERELGVSQARMLAAWGYDLGQTVGELRLADPRLRAIARRLPDLEEDELRHVERVIALRDAVAQGVIAPKAIGWVVERRVGTDGLAK